jgi:hypothetical protein
MPTRRNQPHRVNERRKAALWRLWNPWPARKLTPREACEATTLESRIQTFNRRGA